MKKVAGTLKIDQAQYNELESFSKFSSDIDSVTAMVLDRGRKNKRLLVQHQYSPMSVGEEIALLYCGTHGLLKDIPIERVDEFASGFIDLLCSKYKSIIDTLENGNINDEISSQIENIALEQLKNMHL